MSPESVRLLLFPKHFREFPHRRLFLNLLRTLHIICFSIMVGGIFFHQDKSQITPWIVGTVLSGFGMFLIDLYASCIALFEVRGLGVLIKIFVLIMMPFLSVYTQMALLIVVIVVSSYVSHTTRKVRHRSFMPESFQVKYGVQMNKKD